jgi:hypothetical protein
MEASVCTIPTFAENSESDSVRIATAASLKGCFGQGRRGVGSAVASRLLQFLGSLQKIRVNRTAYEFGDWSASLVGQRLQLLELVFLQEESRPLHCHTVSYRHTYGNRTEVPNNRMGTKNLTARLRPIADDSEEKESSRSLLVPTD